MSIETVVLLTVGFIIGFFVIPYLFNFAVRVLYWRRVINNKVKQIREEEG